MALLALKMHEQIGQSYECIGNHFSRFDVKYLPIECIIVQQ